MDAISANARFDDLDLDARSQWVGKGEKSALHALGNYKQAISIKLATTVGHFFPDLDLDFANVNMACPSCFQFQTQLCGVTCNRQTQQTSIK